MSSSSSIVEEAEVIFIAEVVESSSEEPPREEWSSLILEAPVVNVKKLLYSEGLYDPGSGEICAQHLKVSDSAVFRHVYYKYPAVQDPGIDSALHNPESPITYPDDGQELYLSLCNEAGLSPVSSFYKNLFNEVLDLKYYGVDSRGVCLMCQALKNNMWVKVLDLTDNFLTHDACFHLGDLLKSNTSITELNLTGCRIGPYGLKRLLVHLPINKTLKILNLNKNQLGDAGMEYIANALFLGSDVQKLYLSYNQIGTKGLNLLIDIMDTHNKLFSLDLSWNILYAPGPVYNLLMKLSENKKLQELNLAWNFLKDARVGTAIKTLFTAPNLMKLDLSNNKLEGEAIINLISGLPKAKKLMTLDLSYNPLTTADAALVLEVMKKPRVKLQNLVMDNVFVDSDFVKTLKVVQELKFRKNFTCQYGGILQKFVPVGVDPRDLVLNRIEYLTKKPKKNKTDIALVVLKLLKDGFNIMKLGAFTDALSAENVPLDEDLIEETVTVFAGPHLGKFKTIDIESMVDFVKRKWPDRKLPPTPPPEPEPEPVPKGKDAKDAKKGKK